MKQILWALGIAVLSGQGAIAQSGFGSDDVSSGGGVTAEDSFDLTGLTPEDQTPTGKFTTAGEISMILDATKDSWTAVREYDGNDLVYFTHILSWRCGLKAAKFSINDGPLEDMELPECHMQYKQPNALLDDETLLTYRRYDLGSVQSIRIDLLLDNLTVHSNTVQRSDVLIP